MLTKFSSDKISGTKMPSFFLSRAPSHHSFTFNSRFFHELKHKIRLSETVCGIFHFRSSFVFTEVYIFSTKSITSLTLKRHDSVKIKTVEKQQTVSLSDF